jgi:hypothetical protein
MLWSMSCSWDHVLMAHVMEHVLLMRPCSPDSCYGACPSHETVFSWLMLWSMSCSWDRVLLTHVMEHVLFMRLCSRGSCYGACPAHETMFSWLMLWSIPCSLVRWSWSWFMLSGCSLSVCSTGTKGVGVSVAVNGVVVWKNPSLELLNQVTVHCFVKM